MDTMFLAGLAFRWLHMLAAITAVGGAVFARLVVFPTLAPLADEQRQALHAAMRARWSQIVALSIAFLLVSGLANFTVLSANYDVPHWYHALFGVKVLLALAVFAIASLLAGNSPASESVRKRATAWLNLNILLAVAVVCVSGVLRTAPRAAKPREEAAPAAAAPRPPLASRGPLG